MTSLSFGVTVNSPSDEQTVEANMSLPYWNFGTVTMSLLFVEISYLTNGLHIFDQEVDPKKSQMGGAAEQENVRCNRRLLLEGREGYSEKL